MIELTVHGFSVGDVEDPEIYAAGPIIDWQNTEVGKWVMENAVEKPVYYQHMDYNNYGYKYVIKARFSDEDAMIFRLKWGYDANGTLQFK
jgi:hypothetical protein